MDLCKGIVLVPSDFNGVDWIGKFQELGLNTMGLHSGGGAAHDVLENLKFMKDADFQEKLRKSGIDYEYEIHASAMLLERKMFEAHPDYFIMEHQNARRVNSGNWCVSSHDGMVHVVRNAAKLASSIPSSTGRYFFWGADTPHRDWCHCSGCAGMTASDQSLMTSNRILGELRKTNPEAQVCFLAYYSTFEAPETVSPADGVFCEYAPYMRCYHHALDDASCSINRKYFKVLLDLLKVFPPERMHVLEYWLDSSYYSYSGPYVKPVLIPDVVKRDLKLYYSLGIRSITTFAVRMDGEYFKLYGDRELKLYSEFINAL